MCIYAHMHIYIYMYIDQNDVKKKSKCEIIFILKLHRTFY